MNKPYIPSGMTSATPYLIVEGASELIAFVTASFGAIERSRVEAPGRGVMHSLVEIDDAALEISDASPEIHARTGTVHLYVPHVDEAYANALANGASSLYAPSDQEYGDREAGVEDAFGNYWFLATHVRDVPAEELQSLLSGVSAS